MLRGITQSVCVHVCCVRACMVHVCAWCMCVCVCVCVCAYEVVWQGIWSFAGGDVCVLVFQRMQLEFQRWIAWYGKSYGEYEIIKGDFLLEAFDDIINQAT